MNRTISQSGLALSILVLLNTGCASTRCALKLNVPPANFTKYSTCYVADAKTADGVIVPETWLRLTADRVASELRSKQTFDTVLREAPPKDADCVYVETVYTSYRPGSRALRGFLIGLGTADLKINVRLRDWLEAQELAEGRVHEFWGWGGLMGMSRGIEEMHESACRHIGQGIHKSYQKAKVRR